MTTLSAEDRILAAIRAIPKGQVAGYGEVARRAGLPGRARLVARILSGQGDTTLPWHRVVRSDGRIALPEGSRGRHEQIQRLRAEGVLVQQGRVRLQQAAATLDEQMWGAALAPHEDGPGPAKSACARRCTSNAIKRR